MILLEPQSAEASVLSPIRSAIENGDVLRAFSMMRSQTFPTSALASLYLLEIQGFIDQGLLREAFSRSETLLSMKPFENPHLFELKVRHAFLKIFFQRSPERSISSLRALVNQCAAFRGTISEKHALLLRALTYDHLARALALAVGWHILPPSVLAEAKRLQDAAVRLFADGGARSESISSLLALGQLALNGPDPTPALARAVFAQAHNQALEWQLPFKHFEASLFLTEVEQDLVCLKAAKTSYSYESCLELALRGSHVLGPAMVKLSHGQCLMRLGQDGAALIAEALADYERFGSARGAYAALSALGAHHYQRGELAASEQYFLRAREAADRIGAPIFQIANKVACISLQLPKGDRDGLLRLAREIHQDANACHPARVISSFTLANVFAHLNCQSEAQEVSRAAIRSLKKCGPSPTLSLAYFIHGNTLASSQDWKGAHHFWKKSCDLEKQYGEVETLCQRLQCLALAAVMRALATKDPGLIELAYINAQKYLGQAQKLLPQLNAAAQDKVQAGIEQMFGQLSLLCDQLDEGLFALEGALERYKRQNLIVPQGFTNAQLGLLYYEIGRRHALEKVGDTRSFTDAARHQEEAYQIFARRGMHGLAWRISFHRALTEYRLLGTLGEKSDQLARSGQSAGSKHWAGVRRTLTWLGRSAQHLDFTKSTDSCDGSAADRSAGADSVLGVLPNLVQDSSKVYDFAIQICVQLLDNWFEALRWMERKASNQHPQPYFFSPGLSN